MNKIGKKNAKHKHINHYRHLWGEMKTQFLHEITTAVYTHAIPDEPFWNSNQISSKYRRASIITMNKKGVKHIPVTLELLVELLKV